MIPPIISLSDLTEVLKDQDEKAALVFTTAEGDIGAGYHVTELKHLTINSIDCGGRLADWSEAQLQLMDGQSGSHMSVGRFLKIAAQSSEKLAGLADDPMSIEYAPGNDGLSRYSIAEVSTGPLGVHVHLSPDRALCKPAAEVAWSRSAPCACACC